MEKFSDLVPKLASNNFPYDGIHFENMKIITGILLIKRKLLFEMQNEFLSTIGKALGIFFSVGHFYFIKA